MPLSKSFVQGYRQNLLTVGSGWRAYFAPFNIITGAQGTQLPSNVSPTILDLQTSGPFDTNNPPAGFTDLGWIKEMKVTPESKIGIVRSGYRGAARSLYRGQVGESFDFKFREFSRMAWKIATGTSMFNLLQGTGLSIAGPLSASGSVTYAMGALGYQASGAGLTAGSPTLFVPAGSGANFSPNDRIVVDLDYTPGGAGLQPEAGIPILGVGQVTDPDYIRKNSDFVARVVAVVSGASGGQDGLVLSQKIVGGGSAISGTTPLTSPPAGSKIQKIKGFAAREGGTFISQWTGLFIMDTMDGAQIALYYPHIAIGQFKDIANWNIENIGTTDMTGYELDCTMMSMAFDDPIDGETVVCYRAYYPVSGAEVAI